MNNIQVENIDLENVLFHFSDGAIKSIEEKGLEARIGHNSEGIETHKKVFFSQGITEMLQLVYNLTRVSKDAIDNEKMPVEQKNKVLHNWLGKYSKYKDDFEQDAWKNAYRITYQILKHANYYSLDLNGTTTREFENMSKEEQEKIDYLIDDIDDETGKAMEKHNMHTRFDRGVSPNKISRLCCKNKDNALAVVEYAYQNFLNKVGKENVENQPEMYYMRGLEKFFEYVSGLEKSSFDKKEASLDVIDAKDLSEDELNKICFHFTNKNNENSIASKGMLPQNENDLKVGYNKPKQVYFSKGQEAMLSLMNRFLNLLVDKSPVLIKPQYMSESRRMEDSPLTKTEVFDYMENFLKDSMYLSLDLVEGKDYDPEAINLESKRKHKVTPRNMNTYPNKAILPDKIQKISIDGKTDALSVLTYMYDKHFEEGNKGIDTYGIEEEQLIGEFVEFVREKSKLAFQKKIGKFALDSDINKKEEADRRVQRDMEIQDKDIIK